MSTGLHKKDQSVSIADAIRKRCSVRAFQDRSVPHDVVRNIVETAKCAPSGGNLQPWNVHVVTGDALKDLVLKTLTYLEGKSLTSLPTEYLIYPPNMKKEHKHRRQKVAIDMYEKLGIKRKDSLLRKKHFEENFRLFGAPCALFFTLGREMQQGQWADVGMLMQNIMLLAVEHSLGTCAQEAWAMVYPAVYECLSIAEDQILFCGMALGYPDWDAPVNSLCTTRTDSDSYLFFHDGKKS